MNVVDRVQHLPKRGKKVLKRQIREMLFQAKMEEARAIVQRTVLFAFEIGMSMTDILNEVKKTR